MDSKKKDTFAAMDTINIFLRYCFARTLKACKTLFMLMIPISILIRIIEMTGILDYLSDFLSPIMGVVGLPPQTAIVFLTSMVVNIYGGLLSLFSIYPTLSQPLTIAQMSVLLTMILVAHTFPIELGISYKTGVRIGVMFLIRFGFAIITGLLLHGIYTFTDTLQEPARLGSFFTTDKSTWLAWGLNELKNYCFIALVIFLLVAFIRFLDISGVIKSFNKLMSPALRWLGIGGQMLPLTVIGLTMGIAYGGGLMIEEGKKAGVKAKDIFFSMTLMGLFHSIIEDSLWMLSMGAHWSAVLLFRAVFAFLVTFLFIKCFAKIDETKFERIFMTSTFRNRTKT